MGGMITVRVKSVDYAPDDLYDQTPFDVDLIRVMPGPDHPDYWLGQLRKPLHWLHDGAEQQITHVILAARHAGGSISAKMRDTGVNLAYVTDLSVVLDQNIDLRKCAYVAIGVADAA